MADDVLRRVTGAADIRPSAQKQRLHLHIFYNSAWDIHDSVKWSTCHLSMQHHLQCIIICVQEEKKT